MNDPAAELSKQKIVAHINGQKYVAENACGEQPDDIVSTLLAADIPVPYSCREGDCSSCIGKVMKGKVVEGASDVLAQSDRDIGYIVTCLARPVGHCVEISFDE